MRSLLSFLVAAALISVLVAVLYQRFRPEPRDGAREAARFLRRCVSAVEAEWDADLADVYCRCLSAKGVTDFSQTTTAAGRAAESECRAAAQSALARPDASPRRTSMPVRPQEPPPQEPPREPPQESAPQESTGKPSQRR